MTDVSFFPAQPELEWEAQAENHGTWIVQILCDTHLFFQLRPNIQDYLQMLETVAEYQNSMAAGVLAFGKTQATAKLHVSVEIEKPDLMNPGMLKYHITELKIHSKNSSFPSIL